MKHTYCYLVFAMLLIYTSRSIAQWSSNTSANTPISTAANNQIVPTIIDDGSGGAFIAWTDYRSGTNSDIYAQRVNSIGAVQWDSNGVAISTAVNNQQDPTIVSDGAGGAIITWADNRNGISSSDIYAQRINGSGVVQWTSIGVAISTAANNQLYPTIVSDGAGGAIITWADYRNGVSSSDIYAQRVNAFGAVQWQPMASPFRPRQAINPIPPSSATAQEVPSSPGMTSVAALRTSMRKE